MTLYIVSGDYIDFEVPTKVLQWDKVEVLGKKCLLVKLERHLDYSEFSIPNPVSQFILVDRYSNDRLHLLNEFPIEVHVFIPKDINDPLKGFSRWSDLFNAAWANLYDTYEDALANNG